MTGEIDVMEGFGTASSTLSHRPELEPGLRTPAGVGGTTAGTHTYGVLWSTTGVTFVYDGVVVGSRTCGAQRAHVPVMENCLGSPQRASAPP